MLAGSLLGSSYAQDGSSSAGRKREKYLEYNKTVNWSAGPFDTAAHKEETKKEGDDIPMEEKWSDPRMGNPFSDPQSYPEAAMGNTMSALMQEQQQFNQTGPRVQNEESLEKSTLLDMDISKEISGESESKSSGWGWLADQVQSYRDKDGTDRADTDENKEEDAGASAGGSREKNVTESLETIRTGREDKSSAKSDGGSAYGYSASAVSVERSDKAGGSTVTTTTEPLLPAGKKTSASDQLLATWEREVGLGQHDSRSTTTLPQTKKILEELTRSAIRPTEATTGEGPASRSTVSSTVSQPTSLISQQQAAEESRKPSEGMTSTGFTPYKSSYSQGLSFERERSSSFSQESRVSTYSSGGFGQTASGIRSSTFDQDSSQAPAPASSSLNTFRDMHRSSGTMRPFESSSDPWK